MWNKRGDGSVKCDEESYYGSYWACVKRWGYDTTSSRRNKFIAEMTGKGMYSDFKLHGGKEEWYLGFETREACETYFTNANLGFKQTSMALAIILAVFGIVGVIADMYYLGQLMDCDSAKFLYEARVRMETCCQTSRLVARRRRGSAAASRSRRRRRVAVAS